MPKLTLEERLLAKQQRLLEEARKNKEAIIPKIDAKGLSLQEKLDAVQKIKEEQKLKEEQRRREEEKLQEEQKRNAPSKPQIQTLQEQFQAGSGSRPAIAPDDPKTPAISTQAGHSGNFTGEAVWKEIAESAGKKAKPKMSPEAFVKDANSKPKTGLLPVTLEYNPDTAYPQTRQGAPAKPASQQQPEIILRVDLDKILTNRKLRGGVMADIAAGRIEVPAEKGSIIPTSNGTVLPWQMQPSESRVATLALRSKAVNYIAAEMAALNLNGSVSIDAQANPGLIDVSNPKKSTGIVEIRVPVSADSQTVLDNITRLMESVAEPKLEALSRKPTGFEPDTSANVKNMTPADARMIEKARSGGEIVTRNGESFLRMEDSAKLRGVLKKYDFEVKRIADIRNGVATEDAPKYTEIKLDTVKPRPKAVARPAIAVEAVKPPVAQKLATVESPSTESDLKLATHPETVKPAMPPKVEAAKPAPPETGDITRNNWTGQAILDELKHKALAEMQAQKELENRQTQAKQEAAQKAAELQKKAAVPQTVQPSDININWTGKDILKELGKKAKADREAREAADKAKEAATKEKEAAQKAAEAKKSAAAAQSEESDITRNNWTGSALEKELEERKTRAAKEAKETLDKGLAQVIKDAKAEEAAKNQPARAIQPKPRNPMEAFARQATEKPLSGPVPMEVIFNPDTNYPLTRQGAPAKPAALQQPEMIVRVDIKIITQNPVLKQAIKDDIASGKLEIPPQKGSEIETTTRGTVGPWQPQPIEARVAQLALRSKATSYIAAEMEKLNLGGKVLIETPPESPKGSTKARIESANGTNPGKFNGIVEIRVPVSGNKAGDAKAVLAKIEELMTKINNPRLSDINLQPSGFESEATKQLEAQEKAAKAAAEQKAAEDMQAKKIAAEQLEIARSKALANDALKAGGNRIVECDGKRFLMLANDDPQVRQALKDNGFEKVVRVIEAENGKPKENGKKWTQIELTESNVGKFSKEVRTNILAKVSPDDFKALDQKLKDRIVETNQQLGGRGTLAQIETFFSKTSVSTTQNGAGFVMALNGALNAQGGTWGTRQGFGLDGKALNYSLAGLSAAAIPANFKPFMEAGQFARSGSLVRGVGGAVFTPIMVMGGSIQVASGVKDMRERGLKQENAYDVAMGSTALVAAGATVATYLGAAATTQVVPVVGQVAGGAVMVAGGLDLAREHWLGHGADMVKDWGAAGALAVQADMLIYNTSREQISRKFADIDKIARTNGATPMDLPAFKRDDIKMLEVLKAETNRRPELAAIKKDFQDPQKPEEIKAWLGRLDQDLPGVIAAQREKIKQNYSIAFTSWSNMDKPEDRARVIQSYGNLHIAGTETNNFAMEIQKLENLEQMQERAKSAQEFLFKTEEKEVNGEKKTSVPLYQTLYDATQGAKQKYSEVIVEQYADKKVAKQLEESTDKAKKVMGSGINAFEEKYRNEKIGEKLERSKIVQQDLLAQSKPFVMFANEKDTIFTPENFKEKYEENLQFYQQRAKDQEGKPLNSTMLDYKQLYTDALAGKDKTIKGYADAYHEYNDLQAYQKYSVYHERLKLYKARTKEAAATPDNKALQVDLDIKRMGLLTAIPASGDFKRPEIDEAVFQGQAAVYNPADAASLQKIALVLPDRQPDIIFTPDGPARLKLDYSEDYKKAAQKYNELVFEYAQVRGGDSLLEQQLTSKILVEKEKMDTLTKAEEARCLEEKATQMSLNNGWWQAELNGLQADNEKLRDTLGKEPATSYVNPEKIGEYKKMLDAKRDALAQEQDKFNTQVTSKEKPLSQTDKNEAEMKLIQARIDALAAQRQYMEYALHGEAGKQGRDTDPIDKLKEAMKGNDAAAWAIINDNAANTKVQNNDYLRMVFDNFQDKKGASQSTGRWVEAVKNTETDIARFKEFKRVTQALQIEKNGKFTVGDAVDRLQEEFKDTKIAAASMDALNELKNELKNDQLNWKWEDSEKFPRTSFTHVSRVLEDHLKSALGDQWETMPESEKDRLQCQIMHEMQSKLNNSQELANKCMSLQWQPDWTTSIVPASKVEYLNGDLQEKMQRLWGTDNPKDAYQNATDFVKGSGLMRGINFTTEMGTKEFAGKIDEKVAPLEKNVELWKKTVVDGTKANLERYDGTIRNSQSGFVARAQNVREAIQADGAWLKGAKDLRDAVAKEWGGKVTDVQSKTLASFIAAEDQLSKQRMEWLATGALSNEGRDSVSASYVKSIELLANLPKEIKETDAYKHYLKKLRTDITARGEKSESGILVQADNKLQDLMLREDKGTLMVPTVRIHNSPHYKQYKSDNNYVLLSRIYDPSADQIYKPVPEKEAVKLFMGNVREYGLDRAITELKLFDNGRFVEANGQFSAKGEIFLKEVAGANAAMNAATIAKFEQDLKALASRKKPEGQSDAEFNADKLKDSKTLQDALVRSTTQMQKLQAAFTSKGIVTPGSAEQMAELQQQSINQIIADVKAVIETQTAPDSQVKRTLERHASDDEYKEKNDENTTLSPIERIVYNEKLRVSKAQELEDAKRADVDAIAEANTGEILQLTAMLNAYQGKPLILEQKTLRILAESVLTQGNGNEKPDTSALEAFSGAVKKVTGQALAVQDIISNPGKKNEQKSFLSGVTTNEQRPQKPSKEILKALEALTRVEENPKAGENTSRAALPRKQQDLQI